MILFSSDHPQTPSSTGLSWEEGQAPLGLQKCPVSPSTADGTGLLLIKGRPLYSRNRKSYFCVPAKTLLPQLLLLANSVTFWCFWRRIYRQGLDGERASSSCILLWLLWDLCFIPEPSPAGTGSALLLSPSFLSRESFFGVPFSPQPSGMLQGGL